MTPEDMDVKGRPEGRPFVHRQTAGASYFFLCFLEPFCLHFWVLVAVID